MVVNKIVGPDVLILKLFIGHSLAIDANCEKEDIMATIHINYRWKSKIDIIATIHIN